MMQDMEKIVEEMASSLGVSFLNKEGNTDKKDPLAPIPKRAMLMTIKAK